MKRKSKNIILKVLVIILICRIIYKIYVFNFKYKEWKNEKIVVDILDINSIDDEKITYRVKYGKDVFLLNVNDKEKIYEFGNRLTILSSNYGIKKKNNPYELDYKLYLNSNNITSKIYCIKVLKEEDRSNFLTPFLWIRNNISLKLDEKLDVINSNLIKGFMYGNNTYIDKELKQKFIDIGLGHILCVSGTHLLYLITTFEKVTKSRKNKILNLVLLMYFYFISILNSSLLRPMIMYILSFNSKLCFKKKFVLTIILVMIINPYYILNIGMIFSFLSILSIKLFNKYIRSYFSLKIKTKNKIVNYIEDNISLTLSSQIIILPFELYYFQKIIPICVLSNLFISITLNILMYAIFSLFILFFIPVLSDILIIICNNVVSVIIFQVNFLDKINILNISMPKPNILVIICYYLIILIFLYDKLIILYFWKVRKKLKIIVKSIQYLCGMVIVLWYIVTMYFEKYVIYFNVGQGNMALIHNNTTNILVDCGSTSDSNVGNIINNFLKAKNIKSIDMICITHMHSDHINGIEDVLDGTIKVKSICYTKPVYDTDEYNSLLKKINKLRVSKIEVEEEDNIKIGKINMYILSPPKNQYIDDDDILNANSTVYLISLNNKNYLFMGDSTKNTERYILNKSNKEIKDKLENIYVYQVAHHGSNTSSSEEFVKKIAPSNAIFSAKKSIYGHPSYKVVELFNKYNYKIHLTEKEGAIIF